MKKNEPNRYAVWFVNVSSPHVVDGSVASEAIIRAIHRLLTVYPQIMWTSGFS